MFQFYIWCIRWKHDAWRNRILYGMQQFIHSSFILFMIIMCFITQIFEFRNSKFFKFTMQNHPIWVIRVKMCWILLLQGILIHHMHHHHLDLPWRMHLVLFIQRQNEQNQNFESMLSRLDEEVRVTESHITRLTNSLSGIERERNFLPKLNPIPSIKI